MNKRATAMALALLLALPCALPAGGEEANLPPEAAPAEASIPAEAAPSQGAEAPSEEEATASSEEEATIPTEEAALSNETEALNESEAGGEGDSGEDSGGDAPEDSPESGGEGSAEPSPEATPDPEASPDPDATPSPEVTPDPDATPEPETGLRITVEGAERLDDGSWQIPYAAPEDSIRFRWTAVEGASGYDWEIADGAGKVVDSGSQAETSLERSAGNFLSGRYTLTVRAQMPEGAEAVAASCAFALKSSGEQSGEEQPGERPSGGFGGGRPSGGSSGSSSGSSPDSGEQGLRVTPGEALTSDHASGSKDATPYGAVELSIEDAEQTQLTLGYMELGVSRADGGSFTAEISDGALILTADEGAEWSVNALALEVLSKSGATELKLRSGAEEYTLPTGLTLGGPVYAAYRARGYVSKDFELRAANGSVAAYVDGERYALGGDGTLKRE